ncbi:hypothetical protein [Sphingomonas phyllosphaerae]|uniref:hypothetical protein n=1 Tax=Sphingomonas phyllosphaerae TaxID=257003 RepID=UPI0003B30E65|nr:hypothetical protein [Sphingomonas phyllosphaerae]
MKHIASGSVILAAGERLSVEHGRYTVTFVPDDAAPAKPDEFLVQVPHGYGLGRVSTSTVGSEWESGNTTLRVMFMPGGAAGELVNANYHLFEAD